MKFPSLNRNPIAGGLDIMAEIPQHRIVFQKVRQRFSISNVVDRHKIDVFVAERRAKDIASDSTKTVDAHFDCHAYQTSSLFSRRSHTSTAAVGKAIHCERLN